MIKAIILSLCITFSYADSLTLSKKAQKYKAAQIIAAHPDLKYKCIALGIAAHESANFSSNVYKSKNNMFGIKTRQGTYRRFSSIEKCINYYSMLEKRNSIKFKIKSPEQYFNRVATFWVEKDKDRKNWKKGVKAHIRLLCR